jgi:hypothetical protein
VRCRWASKSSCLERLLRAGVRRQSSASLFYWFAHLIVGIAEQVFRSAGLCHEAAVVRNLGLGRRYLTRSDDETDTGPPIVILRGRSIPSHVRLCFFLLITDHLIFLETDGTANTFRLHLGGTFA